MGIVRESINFERGKSPKKAMGLGLFSMIEDYLPSPENLYEVKLNKSDKEYFEEHNIKYRFLESGEFNREDYENFPIELIGTRESLIEFLVYAGQPRSVAEEYFDMSAEKVFERINFERGKLPTEAMGLGPKAVMIQKYGKEVGEVYYLLKPFIDKYAFTVYEEYLEPPVSVSFSDKNDINIIISQRQTIGDGIKGVTVDFSLPTTNFFMSGVTRFEDNDIKMLLDESKWKDIFSLLEL